MAGKPLTDEQVAKCLGRFLRPNAVKPDKHDVPDLTGWINRYRDLPWDAAGIRAYRKEQKRIRSERVVLDKAAAIMRKDRDEWIGRQSQATVQSMGMRLAAERIDEIEVAIRALARPRGAFEFYALPQLAARGPDVQPYVLTGVVLVGETLAAINRAQHKARRPMHKGIGNERGPIMMFVHRMLTRIYGDAVPSRVTVFQAIRPHFPSKPAG